MSEASVCLDGTRRIRLGVVQENDDPVEATQRPASRISRRGLFRKASPKKMAEDAAAVGTLVRGRRTPRDLVLTTLAEPSLPRPRVDHGCTGCRACVNVCPQDALTFSDADDVFALTVDPTACVQCGEWSRVCPEGVMHAHGRISDPSSELLTNVRLHRCQSCGMRLSPGETVSCTACSARQSLVSDVWSQYGL